MPATTAFSSQGTLLKVVITATPTTITQIKGITGPTITTEYADITNLSSPSNFKEYQAILKDPGPVGFDIIYNPADATHTYLQTANRAQTLEVFSLVISSATSHTLAFSGYVSKFEYKFASGQAGMVTVEIKVTGDIVFT